uniref:Uncharacterized protein n=1 Tax=Megaviridae environmental sample TaxID=1737588 RepID=A0A5J6VH68_9VIRU|nr:MAG: hypothetical protein [Megaviridae environmental sample]
MYRLLTIGMLWFFQPNDCNKLNGECFANNIDTPYGLIMLDNQNTHDNLFEIDNLTPNFYLNTNEFIEISGVTAPDVSYYSWTPYLYKRDYFTNSIPTLMSSCPWWGACPHFTSVAPSMRLDSNSTIIATTNPNIVPYLDEIYDDYKIMPMNGCQKDDQLIIMLRIKGETQGINITVKRYQIDVSSNSFPVWYKQNTIHPIGEIVKLPNIYSNNYYHKEEFIPFDTNCLPNRMCYGDSSDAIYMSSKQWIYKIIWGKLYKFFIIVGAILCTIFICPHVNIKLNIFIIVILAILTKKVFSRDSWAYHIYGVNHNLTGMSSYSSISVYNFNNTAVASILSNEIDDIIYHVVFSNDCTNYNNITCIEIPNDDYYFLERVYLNPYTDTAPTAAQLVHCRLYVEKL